MNFSYFRSFFQAKLEKCTKEQIREITTEARLMRRFDHRNVVRCYGVAAIEEPLYVVMELVPGGGLDGVLQKTQMAMTEKLDVISQVAAGLAYIHSQNIMHRDIAARNVLYGNSIVRFFTEQRELGGIKKIGNFRILKKIILKNFSKNWEKLMFYKNLKFQFEKKFQINWKIMFWVFSMDFYEFRFPEFFWKL